MNKLLAIGLLAFTLVGCQNVVLLETIKSNNDVPTAVSKLLNILNNKGLSHFATIDHKANAENIGLELNPDTVVIFGNPKVGTLLMQCNPSLGIDLPLRILFKTDDAGETTISYFDPRLWKAKHNIRDERCLTILSNTQKALENMTKTIAKQ